MQITRRRGSSISTSNAVCMDVVALTSDFFSSAVVSPGSMQAKGFKIAYKGIRKVSLVFWSPARPARNIRAAPLKPVVH